MSEKLEFTRERLYAALDSVNALLVIEDRNFNIEFENKALRGAFGGNVGKKCYKSYIGRETPCDVCPVKEILHGNKTEFTYYPEASGRIFESYASKFRNSDGSFSIIEVLTDITEHKNAEEEGAKAAAEKARREAVEGSMAALEEKTKKLTDSRTAMIHMLKSLDKTGKDLA